jgi:hypothetical protein
MAAPPLVVCKSPNEHFESDRASNIDVKNSMRPAKEVGRCYISIPWALNLDSARRYLQPNFELEVTGTEKRRKNGLVNQNINSQTLNFGQDKSRPAVVCRHCVSVAIQRLKLLDAGSSPA